MEAQHGSHFDTTMLKPGRSCDHQERLNMGQPKSGSTVIDSLMCTDVELMRSLRASHDFLYGDEWIPRDGFRGSKIREKETKREIDLLLDSLLTTNARERC